MINVYFVTELLDGIIVIVDFLRKLPSTSKLFRFGTLSNSDNISNLGSFAKLFCLSVSIFIPTYA